MSVSYKKLWKLLIDHNMNKSDLAKAAKMSPNTIAKLARDLFALLPVAKVLVHVDIKGNTVLSVAFAKHELCNTNFRNNSATTIVKKFQNYRVDNYNSPNRIERIQL